MLEIAAPPFHEPRSTNTRKYSSFTGGRPSPLMRQSGEPLANNRRTGCTELLVQGGRVDWTLLFITQACQFNPRHAAVFRIAPDGAPFPVHAQEASHVKEITGKDDIFILSGLKQGQILYATLENTSGNLDWIQDCRWYRQMWTFQGRLTRVCKSWSIQQSTTAMQRRSGWFISSS